MESLTHPGLKRSNNEDAVLAEELPGGYQLLAVADGVGGTPGGEVASAQAIETLSERLHSTAIDDPGEALRDAFEAANAAVREVAAKRVELATMSTTLVAGLVRDGVAWLANVGDSRGYLVRETATERLTRDHSWIDEQIRQGNVSADDPLVQNFRNIVTRVVGAEESVEVDLFGPLDLPPGGALLFCSDGLHGPVSDEAIGGAFAVVDGRVGERLIQLAIDAGGPDNVSVAILYTEG